MVILTVNTGSSSVRLDAFSEGEGALSKHSGMHVRAADGAPQQLVRSFLRDRGISGVRMISHRVVHGGDRFTEPVILTDAVEQEIDRLSSLAPLHNQRALSWIRACREVLGKDVPQTAVFDTAFYSPLPETGRVYALPLDLCEQHNIRRYGFHGIAHRAMLSRLQKLRPAIMGRRSRVISFQLGSGCSVTAVRGGQPVDTSMGFSPMEGLVMSTRCGDVDAGVLIHLLRSAGMSVDELDRLLNSGSGLAGLSGVSSDMKTLLELSTPPARLAVELYCYRAKKYLGAYLAALGGAEAVVFGGGVGENAPAVRQRILEGMEWCGIVLDVTANNATMGTEGRISASSARIEAWVIHVDESVILAQDALTVPA